MNWEDTRDYGVTASITDKSLVKVLMLAIIVPFQATGYVIIESTLRGLEAGRKTMDAIVGTDPKGTAKHAAAIVRYAALAVVTYAVLQVVSYGINKVMLELEERMAYEISERTRANDDLAVKIAKIATTAIFMGALYAMANSIANTVTDSLTSIESEYHDDTDGTRSQDDSMYDEEQEDDPALYMTDSDAEPDGGVFESKSDYYLANQANFERFGADAGGMPAAKKRYNLDHWAEKAATGDLAEKLQDDLSPDTLRQLRKRGRNKLVRQDRRDEIVDNALDKIDQVN